MRAVLICLLLLSFAANGQGIGSSRDKTVAYFSGNDFFNLSKVTDSTLTYSSAVHEITYYFSEEKICYLISFSSPSYELNDEIKDLDKKFVREETTELVMTWKDYQTNMLYQILFVPGAKDYIKVAYLDNR